MKIRDLGNAFLDIDVSSVGGGLMAIVAFIIGLLIKLVSLLASLAPWAIGLSLVGLYGSVNKGVPVYEFMNVRITDNLFISENMLVSFGLVIGASIVVMFLDKLIKDKLKNK